MSLQIPLYLYAVEHILADTQGKNLSGVAGSYYILKSPVRERLGIGNDEYSDKAFPKPRKSGHLSADDNELRSIINQAVAFVNEYVDHIASGDFPVEPKLPDTVCTHCDFKTVCRIQVQRDIHAFLRQGL